MLERLLLWVHLLAMAGVFGGIFALHQLLQTGSQEVNPVSRSLIRGVNFSIVLLLLSGFALFYRRVLQAIQAGLSIQAPLFWIVGGKLGLLILLGALVGISTRKIPSGDLTVVRTLQKLSLGILALAVFLGLLLRGS